MSEQPGSTAIGSPGARERQYLMRAEDTTPTTRREGRESQGRMTGRDELGQEPESRHQNALGLLEVTQIDGDVAQPAADIQWPWDEAQTRPTQYVDGDSDSRSPLPVLPPLIDRPMWSPAQRSDSSFSDGWGTRGHSAYDSDTKSSPRPTSSAWVQLPQGTEARMNDIRRSGSSYTANTQDHRETTTKTDSSKQFVLIGTANSGYPSLHSPFSDPQGNIDRPAQLWGSVQRSPMATTVPLYRGISSASQSAAARGE
ncbi:hypothetical protein C8Q73DRAFT_420753 [Cubamyces lactineus]|nr:hypothetical protein C8Q73DRAFT_420753 [Cubamyces lactineus]